MNELQISTVTTQTIDSREAAKLVEKSHKNLLADIRGCIANMEVLGERKIAPSDFGELNIQPSDFFVESSFVNTQNKEMPCYLITRKGCEFIANKLTGQKGTIFTAAYINRFHELEQSHIPNLSLLSPELQAFKHIFDAMAKTQLEQAEMQRQLALTTEKVEAVQGAVTNIKEVFSVQGDNWRRRVNETFSKIVQASGSSDYQALRRETYEMLERRGGYDLNKRLRFPKRRLEEAGATKEN